MTADLFFELVITWLTPRNALEAASAVLGLCGAYLLAVKSRWAGSAFVLWLFSNLGWMGFAWLGGHWFLLGQHVAFAATSILGIWTWLSGPLIATELRGEQPDRSVGTPVSSSFGSTSDVSNGLGLSAAAAGGTPEVSLAVADEHALVSSLEARLTEEVVQLKFALLLFSARSAAIYEELPHGAQSGKHVTRLLASLSLKFTQALCHGVQRDGSLKRGVVRFDELALKFDQLFHEVDLDGRQTVAFACGKGGLPSFDASGEKGGVR